MKRTVMVLGTALALNAQDDSTKRVEKLTRDTVVFSGAGAGIAVAGGTFQFIGGHLLDSNPMKGQPYSAEAVNETTQTLADGNKIVNRSSSMIYRDSEGRERREETMAKIGPWSADGAPAKMIFISDPVAKTSYSLDEKSRTASRMPMAMTVTTVGRGGAAFSYSRSERVTGGVPQVFSYETKMISPVGPAGKFEKLGSQTIEGVLAEGTRTTTTIPAGQIGNEREINIVDERWVSPELGITVMSRHSDPRMGETTYKLTNINRAEPPRALFEVPADYTVNEPAAVKRIITKDDN